MIHDPKKCPRTLFYLLRPLHYSFSTRSQMLNFVVSLWGEGYLKLSLQSVNTGRRRQLISNGSTLPYSSKTARGLASELSGEENGTSFLKKGPFRPYPIPEITQSLNQNQCALKQTYESKIATKQTRIKNHTHTHPTRPNDRPTDQLSSQGKPHQTKQTTLQRKQTNNTKQST